MIVVSICKVNFNSCFLCLYLSLIINNWTRQAEMGMQEMKKIQKEQAESFVRLLVEAHEAIRETIRTGQDSEAMDLLSQCQAGAIQLGNLIESTEGEDFPTISLIESYCESVYRIYTGIEQGKEIGGGQISEELGRIWEQVENSVCRDIPVRKEIVFLPYMASMWDSLESVWKAADEDENVDAYVIPIPYCDKNPDGSVKEMHYEGSLFPEYVPITKYDEYDFESRRPDAVYIHNPYDNHNYVTSVHPFFYSSNLKNFTEQLVYIPYFILPEVDPKDEETVAKIEHFCTVPGVINADKVIVQSEDMRRIYIDVLTKEAGKDSRRIWEEKILGLGSPKMDRVLSMRREDFEIPEEWFKIIRNPEGALKKIVLYNTSVQGLLTYGDKMLKKIENVFQTFKDSQEEVALLWRPHPLIKATIESMRPQLWQKYHKMVETYKAESWGIYDDTPDVDRAMVLSDAYYGDGSSLVSLYKKLGKIVMLQNVDILN